MEVQNRRAATGDHGSEQARPPTGPAGNPTVAVHPRTVASLHEHPRAALIPVLPPEEFAQLRADIQHRGVLDPLLVLRDGTVVDGRHRLRVARELGIIVVPCLEFCPSPSEDPCERMLSAAVLRRHLTPSQRAALAIELHAYTRARQSAVGISGPRRARPATPSGGDAGPGDARSRDIAARLADVSPRTVQAAIAVQRTDPKLFAAVRAGSVSAHAAARQLLKSRQRAEAACMEASRTKALSAALTSLVRAVSALQTTTDSAHPQIAAPTAEDVQCFRRTASRLRALAAALTRMALQGSSQSADE